MVIHAENGLALKLRDRLAKIFVSPTRCSVSTKQINKFLMIGNRGGTGEEKEGKEEVKESKKISRRKKKETQYAGCL